MLLHQLQGLRSVEAQHQDECGATAEIAFIATERVEQRQAAGCSPGRRLMTSVADRWAFIVRLRCESTRTLQRPVVPLV